MTVDIACRGCGWVIHLIDPDDDDNICLDCLEGRPERESIDEIRRPTYPQTSEETLLGNEAGRDCFEAPPAAAVA